LGRAGAEDQRQRAHAVAAAVGGAGDLAHRLLGRGDVRLALRDLGLEVGLLLPGDVEPALHLGEVPLGRGELLVGDHELLLGSRQPALDVVELQVRLGELGVGALQRGLDLFALLLDAVLLVAQVVEVVGGGGAQAGGGQQHADGGCSRPADPDPAVPTSRGHDGSTYTFVYRLSVTKELTTASPIPIATRIGATVQTSEVSTNGMNLTDSASHSSTM